MAKIHPKTADGRAMKRSVSARSMARVGAGAEAATALDEWEAEGGAPAAAGRAGENDVSLRPPLDRLLSLFVSNVELPPNRSSLSAVKTIGYPSVPSAINWLDI